MVKKYLLTIKNNRKQFTAYEDLMTEYLRVKEITLKGTEAEWHSYLAIELDSLCRLHMHALIQTPNNISCKMRTKSFNHDGWHLNLKPVLKGTENQVFNYIEKEHTDPSHLEQESYEYWIQRRLERYNLFSKSFIVYKRNPSKRGRRQRPRRGSK